MDKRLNRLYPFYLALPAVIVYTVFFTVPTLATFIMGFTHWTIEDVLKPSFNGLENFKNLFTDPFFGLAVSNTFVFAAITTICKLFFGLLLALALKRKALLTNSLRGIFYMPAILNNVVVALTFAVIFKMDGILNGFCQLLGFKDFAFDWLGNEKSAIYCVMFTDIWKFSGFYMAIFLAGLQSIPQDYFEAATIDGASYFKQLIHITLPLLAPAFTISVTLNLVGGLKVFDQVFVLTGGGPGFATQVMGTYMYKKFGQGILGEGAAIGLVQFVAVTIIALTLNTLLTRKEVEY